MLCGCSALKPKKSSGRTAAGLTTNTGSDGDLSGLSLLGPANGGPTSPAGREPEESWNLALRPDHPGYPQRSVHYHSADHLGFTQTGVQCTDHYRRTPYSERQQHAPLCPARQDKVLQYNNQGFDSGIDTGSSPDSATISTTTRHRGTNSQTVTIRDSGAGDVPATTAATTAATAATPSPLLLEICESTASLPASKMVQTYRGQLKLAVYLNSGLLTLHVRQAKHLTSKRSDAPCPYVKVSLIPEESGCRTRSRTKLHTDTNRPQFDEKFSFEIADEDFNKRLFVSVYSKDPDHHRGELLGSLSFGINNIIRGKTTVHGWYYLLSESMGRRKHLQAHRPRRHHRGSVSDRRRLPGAVTDTSTADLAELSCFLSDAATSCSELSSVLHDIAPESSVLTMNRGEEGYGFTLSGGCPAHVLTIETDSPADVAGMRVGDVILSINSQDVSRATVSTVAKIIRFHSQIDIEVQPPTAPTPSQGPIQMKDPLSQFRRSSTPIKHAPSKHNVHSRGSATDTRNSQINRGGRTEVPSNRGGMRTPCNINQLPNARYS